MLCLLGVAGMAMAQNAQPQNENWTLVQEQNGVKVYMALSTCNSANAVLLRFENTSNNTVNVLWEVPAEVAGSPMPPSMALVSPVSIVTGACGATTYQNMVIPIKTAALPAIRFTINVLGASK